MCVTQSGMSVFKRKRGGVEREEKYSQREGEREREREADRQAERE